MFDDHLRESQDGSIESDLARNYSEDLVVPPDRGDLVGRCGCSVEGIRTPVVNRLSVVAARSDGVPRVALSVVAPHERAALVRSAAADPVSLRPHSAGAHARPDLVFCVRLEHERTPL